MDKAGHAENKEADNNLPLECSLAKFLLVRWDQLEEIASIIRKNNTGKTEISLDKKTLSDALNELSDPSLKRSNAFIDFVDSGRYEQHDFRKVRIWEVKGDVPAAYQNTLNFQHKRWWFISRAPFADITCFPGNYEIIAPGIIKCKDGEK